MRTASDPTARVALSVTPVTCGALAFCAATGAQSAVVAAGNAIERRVAAYITAASYTAAPPLVNPVPAELTVCPRSDNARTTRRSGILRTDSRSRTGEESFCIQDFARYSRRSA